MSKEYRCICGQVFDNPQKFNGHKQGCKEHIINKYGSLESYYQIKNRNHENAPNKIKERARLIKENNLQLWISEQHTCEKCGKVMTEKFGSGRFCSRSCANSHTVSDEVKLKIQKSVIKTYTEINGDHAFRQTVKEDRYYHNPKYCKICGKQLEFSQRNRKTCSDECERILHQKLRFLKLDEIGISQTVRKRYKYGTYKGFRCDSSWELAFIMFCLDNHISVIRNQTDKFLYYYNQEKHYFYPDFIIDNCYYEIKNYPSDLTNAKLTYFPKDKQIKVLYYHDIEKYLEYAESVYGKHFYKLYDRCYPSWMDNIN